MHKYFQDKKRFDFYCQIVVLILKFPDRKETIKWKNGTKSDQRKAELKENDSNLQLARLAFSQTTDWRPPMSRKKPRYMA